MEQLIQNTNAILNEIKNMSTLPSYLCAIATFLAAIVALFKDEISNVLFGPKISTNIDSLSWQENLIAVKKDDDADDDGAVQKACNYTLDLKVLNEGKRTCRECEFYLNKIEFKHSTNDKYEKLLEINENKPLWISYEKIKKQILDRMGKAVK